MQISIDQLMNGKATRIGKRAYLPTAAYVEPFIERMSKFTKDFIVEVELPKQVTRTVDGDVNADDITYNRVLIQAVMPESCSFDNHDEVIGMVYGLDVRIEGHLTEHVQISVYLTQNFFKCSQLIQKKP